VRSSKCGNILSGVCCSKFDLLMSLTHLQTTTYKILHSTVPYPNHTHTHTPKYIHPHTDTKNKTQSCSNFLQYTPYTLSTMVICLVWVLGCCRQYVTILMVETDIERFLIYNYHVVCIAECSSNVTENEALIHRQTCDKQMTTA
jgi:hypothetical protein